MTLRPVEENIPSTPLDALEREYVRKVLGINGRAGSAIYVESENRISALTPAQCQIARIILYDIDAFGIDTTKVIGGNRGLNYDPERDEGKGARDLRRMLYPTDSNDPILTPAGPVGNAYGVIQSIPAEYKVGTNELE